VGASPAVFSLKKNSRNDSALQVVEKKLSVELCGVRYYHNHGKNITMIAAGCPKLTNQQVL